MQGWNRKRLIEITEKIGSGATPRGGQDAYKESGISLFRSLNVYDGIFKEKNLAFIDEEQASKLSNVIVREGDVLLNITGASIARCCVAPSELLPARVNQHVAIIRPKLNHIDSNFLAYLLASKQYKDALLNTGEKSGSTRQALTKAQLENFEVAIPKLPEQKRIVAIIDEAFEGIDRAIANTEKNLTNAREIFENYVNTVFTQKGNGWENKKLGDICENVEYGSSAKSQPQGEVPVLRMGNIQNGIIDWNNLVYTTDQEEINKYLLKKNDVLFNRTNSDIHVGKTAVYKGERPAIFAGYLIRIHRKEELIDADFLNFYLNSCLAREYGKSIMSRSVNQANINGTKLKGYPISLPPIAVQQQIVEKFSFLLIETQNLEVIYRQKLAALNELKQSILQKAFTGELTADTTHQAIKAAEEVVAA